MARTTRKLSVVSDHGEAEGLDQGYDERAYDLTVGGILRDARERAGYSLREVASLLRIRHAYLQAMEEGRFKDLPGSVYAVGFLKTYAELLDLDVDDLVRRFKSEIDGAPQHTELNFPAPVPEGRMPGGGLVLIALLLGGLVYGGWYYLASNDRTVAEIVAPLPERFAALIGIAPDPVVAPLPEPVTPAAPEAETPAAPSAPVAEAPLPAVEDAPSDTPAPARAADSGAPALPAAPSIDDTPPTVPVSPAEESPATALNQRLDDPATPAQTPAPATAIIADPQPTSPPAAEIPAAAAAGDVASVPPPLPPAEEPAEAVAPTPDNGIVITATAQSWVQIRDAEGNLVMTRVLEPGEVYPVPQTDGLRMVTGNAGGLSITVDGEEAPSLGGPGDVVRDVALNGAQLLAGAAAD